MHRPIGVTVLAILAGLAGLWQIWRALVFVGAVSFNFVGKEVKFGDAQWGAAFWAVILALIWFWVAAGFWNVRAYAWSFGNFIAIFTLIFGFFALIGGATTESETVGWFLALVVFFYLNYPGVRGQFEQNELSLMTPEQRVAVQQMQAAQEAMMRASAAAATPAPAPAAPAPAAPAPTAPPPPPVDPGTPSS
jgi:hypothetical protein